MRHNWICDHCLRNVREVEWTKGLKSPKKWRFANCVVSKKNGDDKPWALCSMKCENETDFDIAKSKMPKGVLRAMLTSIRLRISFTPKLNPIIHYDVRSVEVGK